MKVRSSSVARGIALLCAAVWVNCAASSALAAGVVGTGTAASCTDAALDAAVAGGGLVTFDCGPAPLTIDISTGTGTKTIDTDTTIDGGGLITISPGNSAVAFGVNSGVKFTVENLTIAYGSESDDRPGGISNDGTLIVTNSTFTSSGNSICGISNGGTLIVTSSTFSNHGGCIVNQHGNATVINSTFANSDSGAISNGGTLIVTSSTFSNSGAIFNEGMLTVTNSTLSGNVGYLGGAISNVSGTLTVTNSIFSANRTAGIDSLSGGGAIANRNGTVSVSNSTFSGNSALVGGSGGGAILNVSDDGFSSGILAVTNCTFSGNSASRGGGIYNGGTLTVTNSAFSGNSADSGGGINTVGTATLTNTIIANSTQGGTCAGTITDGGHNLDSDGTCGVGPATDPLLDPAGLANNGGPTQTVALCTAVGAPAGCTAASPGIDAGDESVCAAAPVNGLDQRGYARPGVGHTVCSIGAYEADAIPAPPCIGDCDGNGVVAINELILGVNIVLDMLPEDACSAFANPEGMVDIAQLIKGVNNGLGGCGIG